MQHTVFRDILTFKRFLAYTSHPNFTNISVHISGRSAGRRFVYSKDTIIKINNLKFEWPVCLPHWAEFAVLPAGADDGRLSF